MNGQPGTYAQEPAPTHGLAALLDGLQRRQKFPVMPLRQAIEQLGWLNVSALDGLEAQDERLLGDHCIELVTRRLLTRDQLALALGRMAGLPGVERINLEAAPPAFVKILFGQSGRPQDPPHPASSLAQLLEALEASRHFPVMTLRQALLQLGPLDDRTLDALVAHEPDLLRSGNAGLVTRVLLTADELGRALARTAGLPEVDAANFDIPAEAFRRLPLGTARGHEVLPLGMAQEIFFMASGTPTNEDLRHTLCSVTGCNVILVWADSQSIQARLDAQERLISGEPIAPPTLPWTPPFVVRVPAIPDAPMEQLVSEAVLEVDAGAEQERSAFSRDDSGMARMVRKMILDAQKSGASDIHVEAHADEATTIRFRRDGDLELYLQMPARLRAPLVSRIKIMAKLDIAEHRRPQDGKINFADFGGEQLELRVAIMPTHDGLENVVLRLLSSAKPIPLASLGLQARDEEAIARLSERSFGLVLAAGPTGSGKTTTLHSMLAEINTDERKIWTAEDPIEITQPGLNQVQVNAKIGLTFAAAMRGFLRADPDVIMIGEIRDEETAKVAIEASLTGHLVLSTLHTNNASESVVRLLDIGMDPMNFADSLVGIVAQRLVRALCPRCAQRDPLDAAGCAQLVADYREQTRLSEEEAGARLMGAAGVTSLDQLTVGTAAGCPHCNGKGYKGRIGIYEILQNNPTLRTLIQQRARPAEVFDAAIASGMHSLRHDALEKVVQGRIDLRQARAAYL